MKYSNNYDLVFIVTHQSKDFVFNLLNSIKCTDDFSLFVLVLSQEIEIDICSLGLNYEVKVINISKMSLSKARNIGLEFLRENDFVTEFIMFPDDDTTFDESFFANFKEVIPSPLNYIIPIYCANSYKKLYLGKSIKMGTILNYKHHYMIGSPNQIINYKRNRENLYFDENLGVGALYGSCEDFDLFVRLLKDGEQFVFTDRLYNFHPEKSSSLVKLSSSLVYKRITSYSMGFIYTVKKHNIYSLLPYFFVRPILASSFYFLKLNFKFSFVYIKLFFFRVHNVIRFSSK